MWSSSIIRNRVKSLWDSCLEVVFPRTCAGCGRHLARDGLSYLCSGCASRIDWIKEPSCSGCGAPFFGKLSGSGMCSICRDNPPEFCRCKSLFLYRGLGVRLVHALKYEGSTWLQPQIKEFIRLNPLMTNYLRDSILVPIPLHWWRMHRRGYNQAEVIASAIAAAVPCCVLQSILVRARSTGSQTFLSREQRHKNMRNAFRCNHLTDNAKKYVLIDDVLTTGATLNAAAIAMKQAGCHKISAFTLAHG